MRQAIVAVFAFVVTWQTQYVVPATCIDANPGTDPYTGVAANGKEFKPRQCLELVRKDMQAEFPTRKDADQFVKKAPGNATGFKVVEKK